MLVKNPLGQILRKTFGRSLVKLRRVTLTAEAPSRYLDSKNKKTDLPAPKSAEGHMPNKWLIPHSKTLSYIFLLEGGCICIALDSVFRVFLRVGSLEVESLGCSMLATYTSNMTSHGRNIGSKSAIKAQAT